MRRAVLVCQSAASLGSVQRAVQVQALRPLARGFAMLLLDGRLDGMIGALPPKENADTLLEAVLAAAPIGD